MCNPLLNSFEIARDAMGTSTSKDTTLLAVAGAAVAAAGVSGYYFGKAGLSKKVGATTGSAPLKFYTHPISQPCRSVQALLDAVAIPYEYIKVDIMKGEQKAAPYVAINPTKKIPTLVDNGLNLGEAAAILIYLAEKYELEQYYPKDPVARGKINFWLHWNHTNSRSLTLKLLVPVIFKTVVDEVVTTAAVEFVEAHFAANPTYRFLTGSTPTLADFFLAPEFDQLLPEAFNIFNFTPYPRVTAWLKAVQTDVANYRKNFQPVVDMVSTVLGSK